MQTKKLSTYRLTHYNGKAESVSAENLEQALTYMEITEEDSPVVSVTRTAVDVPTVVYDDPKPVTLTVEVSGGTGNIATPATAEVHAGDKLTLKAIPARNYELTAWKQGDVVLSTEATFIFTVPDVEEDIDIQAVFGLKDINWTSAVSPAEATGSGCLSFPASGVTPAEGNLELLAVAKGNYTFDHWERNGVSIGTNELLQTTAEPLAESEQSAVYTAVFVQG